MFVVDTNVLIYAANEDFEKEHAVCRDLVETWRDGSLPWYLTWPIVYEFLRVVTHPRVLPNPWTVDQGWRFVNALFESEGLGFLKPTERHAEVANQTIAEFPDLRGNVLHDTHTAVLMRENGIREIFTRDRDFQTFSFLKPRDPLAAR